ncbi:MAG: argininosuccinate lyase [Chloroflexi bacterium]|nr:argininosuccinate lyase [Chloroflexota bacterium]
MTVKLWQKAGAGVDARAEAYTAGDIALDQRLVTADVLGSIAHARMLQAIGILTAAEFAALRAELVAILQLDAAGQFVLTVQDEDIHTRVENHLVAALGDTGKKIHTARSRNDQIALDMRLYLKEALLSIEAGLLDTAGAFLDLAVRDEWTPMPGYTHMQRAMLSSVGLWAGSFVEALLDDLALLRAVGGIIDQSPLGSAASYGVPLPIDRDLTARLLGFDRVHVNVLAAQHGRGKYEGMVAQALAQIMLDLSRFAQDTVLFTTSEFSFFRLDEALCTGSSIMPQKRNADILELARGQAQVVLGLAQQIMATVTGLPSGYNADVSLTKGPVMSALDITTATLAICALAARGLAPNEPALRAALSPEVYATDAAYALVEQGVPFRDAYRQVATTLAALTAVDPGPALAARTHAGASGNLGLAALGARLERERADLAVRTDRYQTTLQRLVDGALD